MSLKIKTLPQLKTVISRVKAEGKKIVFTNGCFDILHRGHVEYLAKAKKLGDILVVGLNSDSSVKCIKGPKRPVNSEKDRAIVLSGLESVDYIVIFKEDTPYELIKVLKPDVLVKGGDWKPEDIVGNDLVKKVVSISFVKGYSTTKLLCKINYNV
jgi:D-beta-D-heptose 7-phosphate kinase/D-beta-D-heptose 1-phosphate adenosyltransferase